MKRHLATLATLAAALTLSAAPPAITPSVSTVSITTPGTVAFPADRQLVQTFDNSTLSTTTPLGNGTLGLNTDTGVLYLGSGSPPGPGDWSINGDEWRQAIGIDQYFLRAQQDVGQYITAYQHGDGTVVQIVSEDTGGTPVLVNLNKLAALPPLNTIALLTSIQTLTNKTISGASNTLSNIPLGTAVTGTLPVANGGTGGSTPAAARTALLPSYTGNGGKAVRVNAGETDIEYFTASGSGTVTTFSFTDSTGIDGTVTNATTTPALSLSLTSAAVGLGSVENTALSTWTGTTNITTLGTITTGTWNGTAIGDSYISSAATWTAKEPAISAGTSGQYWRGDKTFQTLDKSAVGLGNVENTSLSASIGSTIQAYDADLSDLADGSLSGGKIGSGIDASNITTGTLPASRIGTGDIGATQIAATAVTPGSYTAADITVDADGRITAASNGSGGGATITAHTVATDQTTTSTSYADITGMTAAVSANKRYVFEAYINWTSSGSTEGIGLALNGPASAAVLTAHVGINAGANYYQFAGNSTYDSGVIATSGAGATVRIAHVRGVITTGGTSGTLAIRYRAETGGSNSATVAAGSVLILTALP